MYGRVPVADLFCSVVPSAVFARFGAMLQLEGAEAAALQVSYPIAQRSAVPHLQMCQAQPGHKWARSVGVHTPIGSMRQLELAMCTGSFPHLHLFPFTFDGV